MLNIALARQSRTAPQLADAMLLLVAVIWGSSYAATKQAPAFYPVLGFIALRFTLTFLVLVPQLRGAGLTALRPGLPLGLILLGVFICETQGVAIISAGNAAFLIQPVRHFYAVGGMIGVLRTAQRKINAGGAAVVAGRLLVVRWERATPGTWGVAGDSHRAAARLFGVLYPAPDRAAADTGAGVNRGPDRGRRGRQLAAALHFSTAATLALLVAVWGIILYLALFATLFAFFAQNYAAGRTSPSRLSLLLGTELLFGALRAALLLNEHLTALGWVGGGCIVASLLMVLTRRTPPQQDP